VDGSGQGASQGGHIVLHLGGSRYPNLHPIDKVIVPLCNPLSTVRITSMSLGRPILIAAIVLLLCSCDRGDTLDQIQRRGELVVVSRNSPTTYYIDKNGPTGFEYALIQLLAEELGVRLHLESVFTLPDIFNELERGEADIAAAGLTLTEQRAARYPHSMPYYKLTPQVIYVAGKKRPRTLPDLIDRKIAVLRGSSHEEQLNALRQEELPDLSWHPVEEADTLHLLEMLKQGQAELAVIDSNEFAVQQSLYPRQKVAFSLGEEQAMVWYLAPDRNNTRLKALIDAFFQRLQADGTMEQLRQRYFGHTDDVTRMNAFEFTRAMRDTLPRHLALIKQVAREHQVDWQLLAAIAYQESRWNPSATSPTGVRGMMMLTKLTASELGVDNRLDAAQSLRGGTRYFKELMRRLPKSVQQPDRTWMALAAYNVGIGHLHDARALTERQGGNPNLWQDVMERLPLLQKSQYHKNTRFGYARGQEAVTLVQNIRHYYSILTWQDIPDQQPEAPLSTEEYFPEIVRDITLWAL
jgi:membrane-bound lytic murein transglycosylase F